MAYHITWGVYGGRLHGSAKPHVDRDHNEYGTPFAPPNSAREQDARDRMSEGPVSLDVQQRVVAQEAIVDVATRYEWTIHALAI